MSYQSKLNDRYADVQKAQAAQDYVNGNIQRFYESDAYQNGTASLADYTKMIDDYTNAANAAARAGRRYNRYARLHQSMAPTNQLPGPRPQPAADQVQEGPAKVEVAAPAAGAAATQQNAPTFTKFYTPDEVAAAQQERENARLAQEAKARAAEKAAADAAAAKAAAEQAAAAKAAQEQAAAEAAAEQAALALQLYKYGPGYYSYNPESDRYVAYSGDDADAMAQAKFVRNQEGFNELDAAARKAGKASFNWRGLTFWTTFDHGLSWDQNHRPKNGLVRLTGTGKDGQTHAYIYDSNDGNYYSINSFGGKGTRAYFNKQGGTVNYLTFFK